MSAWGLLGMPSSLAEAIFLFRISAAAGVRELDLAELMPGDWELVCESHGYDGPLRLDRYGRTYPPAAPPQDGVWGLVFIAADGSYESAVGSCRYPGVGIHLGPGRVCVERSGATLRRQAGTGECASFGPAA